MGADADKLAARCEEAYLGVLRVLVEMTMDWGKENLLSNLRTELSITNAKHQELLKIALSEKQSGGKAAKRSKPGAASRSGKRKAPSGDKRNRSRPSGSKAKAGGKLLQGINELVGTKVSRWWPHEGGWVEAVITDYDPVKKQHCVTYNYGTKQEQWEWYDVQNAAADECKVMNEKVNLIGAPPAAGNGEAQQLQAKAADLASKEEELAAQLKALEDSDSDMSDTD